MRLAPFFVVAPLAAASLLLASSARADGAYVSLRSQTGAPIGARVPLASFNATTTTVSGMNTQATGGGAGKAVMDPITFEIDSAVNVPEYYAQTLVGTLMTVFVELTTADANGQEQVTSTATFTSAMMKTVALTFGPSGFSSAYSVNYTAVVYGAPGGAVLPITKRPRTVPVILRSPIRVFPVATVTAPTIDGATLTLSGGANGLASVGPVPLKTISVQFNELLTSTSTEMQQGQRAGPGRVQRLPITVTQAHGGTAAFQQSVATTKMWSTGTIALTHSSPTGATTVLNIGLQGTAVSSEGVGIVGGVTTESTNFDDLGTTITKP